MSNRFISRRVTPALCGALLVLLTAGDAIAQGAGAPDPRVSLTPGWRNAGTAARHMELLAHADRPEGFYDSTSLGNLLLGNSDMAFRDNLLFLGSFHGFQVWDIADPAAPRLRKAFVCPGGQGDMSVHGTLLFMSVEMPNGRVDCGTQGELSMTASPDRFMGVRIFDIGDVENPRQVAAVQTCRGSHTHTLVTDPDDTANVYIYVSGTSMVRSADELAGCSGRSPEEDANTALFRIEVIQVPLAAPQDARIVNAPRIFANKETGDIAGLWRGGSHGENTQSTATTNQCHDITAYPAIGLAAGACSGNGILLDISDPANPVRVAEVLDPNFAYWHSATFNNDGTTVLFTDEWGGGMAARCQASDRREWGADAIFTLQERKLEHAGYYKLPAAQGSTENCVAHNGSLIPVPGRDLMVQAWYQGGVSVFDFTDPANPVEIAYFDRGPIGNGLLLAGYWGTYWYNGHIYGSEIGRGLDVFRLLPSEQLTQNEIDAANLVRYDTFNPQLQPRAEWPARFEVARAYLDQLARDGIDTGSTMEALARVERVSAQSTRRNELQRIAASLPSGDALERAGPAARRRVELLGETLRALATAFD
jgi:hypothetical protein